jgi:hypothetical protein
MSLRIKKNNTVKQMTNSDKKFYCKVCFDAGKSEREYTSHNVKSLSEHNGMTIITCPTLLSNECRYCYKIGHTAKFCSLLKKNNKDNERVLKVEVVEKSKPKVHETIKIKSKFSILQADSDSEEEETNVIQVKVKKDADFPSLSCSLKKSIVNIILPKTQPDVKSGWATIAAKPKDPNVIEKLTMKANPQTSEKSQSVSNNKRSWAEYSDSDESDEEEEEEIHYQSREKTDSDMSDEEEPYQIREDVACEWSNKVMNDYTDAW